MHDEQDSRVVWCKLGVNNNTTFITSIGNFTYGQMAVLCSACKLVVNNNRISVSIIGNFTNGQMTVLYGTNNNSIFVSIIGNLTSGQTVVFFFFFFKKNKHPLFISCPHVFSLGGGGGTQSHFAYLCSDLPLKPLSLIWIIICIKYNVPLKGTKSISTLKKNNTL